MADIYTFNEEPFTLYYMLAMYISKASSEAGRGIK